MSGNTSATGGSLLPTLAGPAPLQGDALGDYIQQWIVGITGMDGKLVRPAWQANPGTIPRDTDCWCAFSFTRRSSPDSPYFQQDGDAASGAGETIFSRTETLTMLTTWYALGVGGAADDQCSVFHDGVAVPQNLEYLFLQGFGLGEVGEPVAVPMIIKERWQYRVDLPLVLRRTIFRRYPVRNVLSTAIFFGQPPSSNPFVIGESPIGGPNPIG